MQTPQKGTATGTMAAGTPVQVRHAAQTEKLAAFLLHHHHLHADGKLASGQFFVDLKGNRQVAEHLGISHEDLERGYETLSKEQVIKRHGEYRVEILNKARLSEIASKSKQQA
jgi:Crp-like helix-turn-helix domain